MATEAQKRAKAKYDRENMVQRVVRFSPNERDLLEHLDRQPNRMGYIKALIRADIERGKTMYEIIYHDDATDNESRDRVSCPLEEAIEWAKQQVREGEHWYIIDEDGETVADSL